VELPDAEGLRPDYEDRPTPARLSMLTTSVTGDGSISMRQPPIFGRRALVEDGRRGVEIVDIANLSRHHFWMIERRSAFGPLRSCRCLVIVHCEKSINPRGTNELWNNNSLRYRL